MAINACRSNTKRSRFALLLLLGVAQGACSDASEGTTRRSSTSEPVTVSGRADCADCAVELVTIAVLGDPEDEASIRADAPVAGCMVGVPGDSTYIVSGLVGGGQLLEYDSEGRAKTYIGRKGQGPDEFGSNLRLIASRDTLFVLDISLGRMAVTDRSGRFLRTFRLPVRVHSVDRLASGHFLLHGRPVSSDDGSPLFRVLDEQGVEAAAFGSPSPRFGEKDQWVISARADSGFLAARMWEYEIYRGTEGGDLALYITRRADWFPTGSAWNEKILVTDPPPPLVTHVREDASGLVWTFVTVADQEWSAEIPNPGSVEWFRDSFDTIVEVIDPRQGRILATTRFDDWIAPVCGSENVYSVVSDTSGDTRTVVFRPRLRTGLGNSASR